MAYVLGFFAADGNLIKSKRGGHFFNIEIGDKDLLLAIQEVLGSDHVISERPKKQPHHSALYRLQIGSREIYQDLVNLGFTVNKSLRMKLPQIPEPFFGDFVRGYFDGDGNVWAGIIHKGRKVWSRAISTGFTSGCRDFLADLHKSLQRRGIQGGSLSKKAKGHSLKYSTNDSLKIYKIMYDRLHSKLFLERKRIVFRNFFKERLDNAAVV